MNIFKKVKDASQKLKICGTGAKDNALRSIADRLIAKKDEIKSVNQKDLDIAKQNNLSSALIDRLVLDDKRIYAMAEGVREIAAQDDPVGIVEKGIRRPNGLMINKVRVPIGVVGIIYESRPNVTVDAAALCLKSGNASVLRGGKEAVNSNLFLGKLISESLEESGIDRDCVLVLDDPDRKLAYDMLRAKGIIDIIIPRGGESLINFVVENSLIPIVKHDKGVCHTYIDSYADIRKGVDIAYNAKVSRPGVCNAMETLLIHESVLDDVMTLLLPMYFNAGVELVGCEKISGRYSIKLASVEDWSCEYLSLKLSIKSVESLSDAIVHINKYGSQHSDAIVTENYTNAQRFLNEIDSAAVYVNASTRFTDGSEFGLGAEIGISTQKLHCRGPMGAYDLTTTKYQIYGSGQIR